MGIYNSQDIKTDISGAIVLSDRGDLDIASCIDTYKSAVNFVIRTDYGDYAPNKVVGCNLGAYIGEPNIDQMHKEMEESMNRSIIRIMNPEDFYSVVVPFDYNETVAYVFMAGTYLVDNEYRAFDQERVTFLFPYIQGDPTQIFNVD